MSTIDTSTFSARARAYLDHQLANGYESPADIVEQLLANAEEDRLREIERVSARITKALEKEAVPYDPKFFDNLRSRLRARAGIEAQ